MAYFNKKWSELSQKESVAMKNKYGSREAWQKAKEKSQSASSKPAPKPSPTPSPRPTPKPTPAPTQDISKRYTQKYSDLTPEQKAKSGSRSEHMAKRESLGLRPTPTPTPAPAPSKPAYRPVPKPSPRPTPKPSPRPTPKPSPRPTPTPTPTEVSKRYNQKWSELDPEQKAKSGSRASHMAKREQLGLKDTSSSKPAAGQSTAVPPDAYASQSTSQSGTTDNTTQDISKRYYKKYSELTDEQKAKSGTRAEHRARREELGVYDSTPNRTSRSELAEMVNEDTSLRDLKQLAKSEETSGGKAQAFLNKKIAEREAEIYGGDLDSFDTTAGGIGSNKGADKISKADLKALETAGHSREDIIAMVDSKDPSVSDGNRAQKLLNKWKSEFVENELPEDPVEPTPTDPVEPTPTDPVEPTPTDPVEPTPTDPVEPTPTPTPTNPTPTPTNPTPTPVTPTPTPTPTQPPTTDIDTGDVDQEIDQDITNEDVNNTDIDDSFDGGTIGDIDNETNIVGDNNYVDNSVDNSNNSRYYGGNSTVWNIQKGDQNANTGFALGDGNYTGGVDTTLSDLTTLGYGKPDDSPAANAKFVDMYQTLNSDAQAKYEDFGSDTANKYIRMARANNPVDFAGIQRTLSGYIDESVSWEDATESQKQRWLDSGKTKEEWKGLPVDGTAQNFLNRQLERQTMFMGDYFNFQIPNYVMPEKPKALPDTDDLEKD